MSGYLEAPLRNDLLLEDKTVVFSTGAALQATTGSKLYSEEQWLFWAQKLQKTLHEARYEHCVRVAGEAACLAGSFGLDKTRACLAGLLHDVARDICFETLFAYAERYNIMVGPEERSNPIILHADVGAALLRHEWAIDDEEVLKAIALHTVASPNMDNFCQVIYLADIIEPGRQEWPGLQELRKLSYENLDQAMLWSLQESFAYLKECGTFIHPRAQAAYDYLIRKLKAGKC
ncbi:MAG: bis(5'-nucleosyl)-tetraphosphatase (symmetrical) YqeK [Firmicutes bacterium]|nr:bis(5'-nucleosyl)-tetraphosphatase (symmetrical) YqeK [Bacillota bacterium]